MDPGIQVAFQAVASQEEVENYAMKEESRNRDSVSTSLVEIVVGSELPVSSESQAGATPHCSLSLDPMMDQHHSSKVPPHHAGSFNKSFFSSIVHSSYHKSSRTCHVASAHPINSKAMTAPWQLNFNPATAHFSKRSLTSSLGCRRGTSPTDMQAAVWIATSPCSSRSTYC